MKKRNNPTQYASGYTIDLYCDYDNHNHSHGDFPHSFSGETFIEVTKEAKSRGWAIHKKTRTATCPKCNKINQQAKDDSDDAYANKQG